MCEEKPRIIDLDCDDIESAITSLEQIVPAKFVTLVCGTRGATSSQRHEFPEYYATDGKFIVLAWQCTGCSLANGRILLVWQQYLDNNRHYVIK